MVEEEYAWTEPKPSGIKLRDLYRTFDDDDDGGIRRKGKKDPNG